MRAPSLLERAPRLTLGRWPTPLESAPRLSDALGAEVWLKRDDTGTMGLDGNKVRKLEFLLGEAVAQGCDTVVTFGALQSNHARQTAAACAKAGLACELVLTHTVPRELDAYTSGGNLVLDELFGATVHVLPDDDDLRASRTAEIAERNEVSGHKVYWVPPGGSSPTGTLGYVHGGLELAAQLADAGITPSRVVVATSTGGTQAGLLCGLRLAGVHAELHGVAVYRDADRSHGDVTGQLVEVCQRLDVDAPVGDVVVADGFRGPGYGIPTPGMVEAVRLFARCEGVVLDPVYSGKAAAALVHWCRTGEATSPVVFMCTGGAPGMFAYPDVFSGPAAG